MLLRSSVPGLLKKWLSRVPASVRVPALVMALLPVSSSISPLKVALAPPLMVSVRPAKTVEVVVPLAVKLAPVSSVVVPLPVQVPLLQVLPNAVRVRLPLPASVPPLCAKTPATLVAASTVSVPDDRVSPPPKVLACATVRLPPPICSVRPLATLRLRMMALTPLPITTVGPAVEMNTSSPVPGSVPSPQLNVLPQLKPSPRPVQ